MRDSGAIVFETPRFSVLVLALLLPPYLTWLTCVDKECMETWQALLLDVRAIQRVFNARLRMHPRPKRVCSL